MTISESGLAKDERFGRRADQKQEAGEIETGAIGVAMLRAERLFADGQRALAERPSPCIIALLVKQGGEVVETRRRPRMFGAERVFANGQRALVEWPRPRKFALVL